MEKRQDEIDLLKPHNHQTVWPHNVIRFLAFSSCRNKNIVMFKWHLINYNSI